MATKQLLSLREYSEITGRHYQTAYRDCKTGIVPSIRLGGKRYIPASAIETLLASASTGEKAAL